jgi:uncharacterized protein (DUF488 family)
MARTKREPLVVYTVGHSTRELPAFLELLKGHGIKQLVDVRTIPRSRKNPQYNAETLPQALRAAGIRYVHLAALGGLRHPARNSVNIGWRNASFRGFADYMQRTEFAKGLDWLMKLASARPTAIMCAEALPWRCHRSLIADALRVRDVRVMHFFGANRAREHTLTLFARVKGLQITYPEDPSASAPAPHLD